MIYVIYFFAGVFVLIAAFMLFAYYRSRHFGLFIMATTYASSGLLALSVSHWWPLVTGFVLVWLLRFMGLEPEVEYKEEDGSRKEEGKSEQP
ncbi:MAG TPA: hypothetical protein VJQ51_09690 [Burkholderiales bacterium]|nr:hypothetical protein [Burkholderiales bacterium]